MVEDVAEAWNDPDDTPELTQEWFDKATLKIGDAVVRHGATSGKGPDPKDLTLKRDGAQHYPAALTAETIDLLRTSFSNLPKDRAGTRLHDLNFRAVSSHQTATLVEFAPAFWEEARARSEPSTSTRMPRIIGRWGGIRIARFAFTKSQRCRVTALGQRRLDCGMLVHPTMFSGK